MIVNKGNRWLNLAAEQGLATSQSHLAELYLHVGTGSVQGDGIDRRAEAMKWNRLAAAQNDVFAQFALGQAYEHGSGVAQDRAEAIRWYRLAVQNELSSAASYKLFKF